MNKKYSWHVRHYKLRSTYK